MLLGNYSLLNKSFERPIGGQVASGNRSSWNQTGGLRNWGKQTGLNWSLASLPQGHAAGGARMLPRKAGGMTARFEARLAFSSVANGVMGFPIIGAASLSISASDAVGQLISSGNGSASLSITTSPLLLTASINGTGSATFTLASNTPLLGAIAESAGASSVTFSGLASILPLNDASPLRMASATFRVEGALTPYATGTLTGTTDAAGLTPGGIANAVWQKVIEAGFSAEQIIRLLAAQATGAATGLEGSNPVFVGLDGVTVRIDGNYVAGTRTIDSLNGA